MELYEIGRPIGGGSFGQVFLCRHKQEEKPNYVVKRLRLADSSDRDRDNIEFELKLLQKLRHPNIISYKDNFIDRDGNLCIVMVYCEGGDMFSKIRVTKQESKTFSEPQILDWLVQTALAIYYLHNQKILHRDLKPQNIFLRFERVQLGDFGIAKMLDTTQDIATTCIGTPYYMAPEVFKSKPYSYKSDIWSLGCILYEMCNLRRAFDAQNFNALAIKILKGTFPMIIATYSKQLRDLIYSMLKVNPNKRPTILEILNKPFIKKRVEKYIIDTFNRNSENSNDIEYTYLDTLKEQADLLGINLNPVPETAEADPIKKYPSSKDLIEGRLGKGSLLSKRGEEQTQTTNGHNSSKRKSVYDKQSMSSDVTMKRKDEVVTTTSSSKAISFLGDEKEKQAFVDHKKKIMIEKERKKLQEEQKQKEQLRSIALENSKTRAEAQARFANQYRTHMQLPKEETKSRPFKMQEDYDMEESKDVSFDEDIEEIIPELEEEDVLEMSRLQSAREEENEQIPEEYTSAYYKLLDKIRLLRHRCETGLGLQKYRKAYNAVMKGEDRESLIAILGEDQIGYWHIIDQILFNESFLKMMQRAS